MKKRILTIILAGVMVVSSCMPVMADSEDVIIEDYVSFADDAQADGMIVETVESMTCEDMVDKNDGKAKGKMAAQSMVYGKSKKLSKNTFTNKKYKFMGRALSKADAKKGIVAYKNKATIKNLSSKNKGTVTLYAVWKKK